MVGTARLALQHACVAHQAITASSCCSTVTQENSFSCGVAHQPHTGRLQVDKTLAEMNAGTGLHAAVGQVLKHTVYGEERPVHNSSCC